MGRVLIASSMKSVSLIDVLGHTASTVWFCGCNLKCPFCHNWRIADADRNVCEWKNIDDIIEKLGSAIRLGIVEYLHVTGGEPLLQHKGLIELYQRVEDKIKTSLDSNLTLPERLSELLESVRLDHLATDIKAPPHAMYGLPREKAEKYWENFLASLTIIVEKFNGVLEVRIPFHTRIDTPEHRYYVEKALSIIRPYRNKVIRKVKLLGPPITTPRSPEFFRK
ncbi:MAG: radical SAM protein [Crenarchaeota archaeon]|nr:radical SAM protein [Thermoproteota archaeon]